MKTPKSWWPEYLALVLFVAGPIILMIASFVALSGAA
jgi:hypothetical protein